MNKYVLFDLEATCCNDGSIPKHKTEIIEIGAICIDDNLNVLGKFVTFVKPIEYPKLHNFCTELTSITQSDVDSAEPLSSVVVDFKIWLDSFNPVWCGAWGFFDRNIFLRECKDKDIFNPIEHLPYINVSLAYQNLEGTKRKKGLGKVMRQLNIECSGVRHRALDDTLDILKVIEVKNDFFDFLKKSHK